eukprot:361073-Chlamydomonas_euryale.AAC.1
MPYDSLDKSKTPSWICGAIRQADKHTRIKPGVGSGQVSRTHCPGSAGQRRQRSSSVATRRAVEQKRVRPEGRVWATGRGAGDFLQRVDTLPSPPLGVPLPLWA